MRRKFISLASALLVATMLLNTSCIGSFSLTNKLMDWNKTVGNKFVNEVVFFAFWILPVYEVTALADVLVLNSIEFWSGDNPVASGKRVIEGNDGRYLVECDGRGYTITSELDKQSVRMDFDIDEQTWSVTLPSGETYPFLTFVDDINVKVPTGPNGQTRIIPLNDAGLWAYQTEALNQNLASAR